MTIPELCTAYDQAQKDCESGDHDKVVDAYRRVRELRTKIEEAVDVALRASHDEDTRALWALARLTYFNTWFALRGGWR